MVRKEARNARVSEFQIVDGWCNVMAEHQDDDGSPPSFINLLPPCPPFLLLRAWSYGGGGGEGFMEGSRVQEVDVTPKV